MQLFEDIIELFLTADGCVFVCPQYAVVWDAANLEGGSNPDFVAIDFRPTPREVVVVEVGTASDLGSLFSRIAEREARWFNPLRSKMLSDGVSDASWNFRFLGFIRRANIEKAQTKFEAACDVSFYAIEDATFPWSYWEKRVRDGLPRKVGG